MLVTTQKNRQMRIHKKTAGFLLAIALSFTLGAAAVARTSHETHSSRKVYVSGQAKASIVDLCFSKHMVDENGDPLKIVHINACGKCVVGDGATIKLFEPLNILVETLAPRVLIQFHVEPVASWISFPAAAPRASQAPPVFS